MLPPGQLKEANARVEEDNWILRTFLKGREEKEVDELVHNLHKKSFGSFNCVECLNCCKEVVPVVGNKEIKAISKKLGLTVQEFRDKYLIESDEGFQIKDKPCPFLRGDGCSIYETRPKNCREYPYTHKKEIWTRLGNLVDNCRVCPVVFEIFEILKEHYGDEFEDYKEDFRQKWG